jgi:hypothetical protein
MIDIAIQAFVLSLPVLVAIDKGRMIFAFILFLIMMTPIWGQFIFFELGEYVLTLFIVKWVSWISCCIFSFKIKGRPQI